MAKRADSIGGRCLCGAVTIKLESPESHVEICHCDMCRRWTGSFYAAQEGSAFELGGEEMIVTYKSSDWAERAFCGKCGSNLWFKFLPTGNRSFLAGLFDENSNATVHKEIFTDERVNWTDLTGDHVRQTGAEVIAEAKAAGFNFD